MNGDPIPGWHDSAACKGQTDVMFAHTDRGDGTDRARRLCGTCPHVAPCLQFALDEHLVGGVYGGHGPLTRSRIARGLPPKAEKVTVAACGTFGGYRRHIQRAEPTCDPCRLAWNDYKRHRRAILNGAGVA